MKIKLAVGYGSICGGCDVAFIDLGEKLIDLTELVDIVFWPALVDTKEEDLRKLKEIDVGMFFGAIRTDKHKATLELLREKARLLVAFGTCACYGGVLGLANAARSMDLLKTGYVITKSTENPKQILPGLEKLEGIPISIPKIRSLVSPISDFVDVDIWVPGCPPPVDSIIKLLDVLKDYQRGHLPPKGLFIAEDRSLCEFCDREKPEVLQIEKFRRVHEGKIDEKECLLKQGILCLGPVTRGGCGARCIKANMPCRGCFGPVPNVEDQGTKFITAVAAALKAGEEREVGEEELKKLIEEIHDPLGLFYMFSLAASIINRKYLDLGGDEDE